MVQYFSLCDVYVLEITSLTGVRSAYSNDESDDSTSHCDCLSLWGPYPAHTWGAVSVGARAELVVEWIPYDLVHSLQQRSDAQRQRYPTCRHPCVHGWSDSKSVHLSSVFLIMRCVRFGNHLTKLFKWGDTQKVHLSSVFLIMRWLHFGSHLTRLHSSKLVPIVMYWDAFVCRNLWTQNTSSLLTPQ